MAARRWDGFAYAAAVVLPRLPSFLFLPAITAALPLGDMGLLASAWVFLDLFQTLAGLGLHAALGRFFPLAEAPERRRVVLAAALSGIALGNLALAAVSAGLRAWPPAVAALPFLGAMTHGAFAALLASAVLGNFSSALFVYLRAEQKALPFLGVSGLGSAVEAAVLIGLWATRSFSLPALLAVEAVKQAAMVLAMAVSARRDLRAVRFLPELRGQLAFGLWFVPVGLGEWFIAGSDRFWLGKLGGLADVGIYGFLYRFVMPISILFSGGLLDAHARLYKYTGEAGEDLARNLFLRYLSRGGAIAAAYALALPPLLWIASRKFGLFPADYLRGLPAAPLMAAVLFTLFWGRYYGTILEYRMRARTLMGSHLAITCLSAMLIPAVIALSAARGWSLLCGTALGTLATQIGGNLILARLAHVGGGWRLWLTGLAALLACLASAALWARVVA